MTDQELLHYAKPFTAAGENGSLHVVVETYTSSEIIAYADAGLEQHWRLQAMTCTNHGKIILLFRSTL